MRFFNTVLIFTPAVFILCKKMGPERTGGREFWYTYLLIYDSNKLAYLQLINFGLPKQFFQKS